MVIETGSLHTSISTVVSGANSSIDPLISGGMFIGEWESTENFSSVVCAVKSDQDGILYLEFSIDGISADSSVFYVIPANSNGVQRQTINRKYFRAVFFNVSVSDQTVLRMQTIYGHHQLLTSSLNSDIPSDADALIVKSISFESTASGLIKPLVSPTNLVTNIDESVANTVYFGYADAGVLSSASLWKIKKISVSGLVSTTTYADGNTNFDNIWDNRLTLLYS